MYTWLAPEMPRPGCVWTHALIISFADIARFDDLSVLMGAVVRPNIANGFEKYAETLSLSPTVENFSQPRSLTLNHADVARVIQIIYSEKGTGCLNTPLGEQDGTIFSIWSQQWPRLRRAFSFRTAVSLANGTSNKKEFDLAVIFGTERGQPAAINAADDLEAWEKIATDDVLHPHSTDFRRFLWRYGSDMRMGRKRFKFLTEIYAATRAGTLQGKKLLRILTDVMKILPSIDEGKMLKSDLIGRNQYSMIPRVDPIDVLSLYVKSPIANKLPAPGDETFDAILEEWEKRSDEILSIAEFAAEHDTELGEKVLARLASVTSSTNFLHSTEHKPNLRRKFLRLTPALLDSDYLVHAPRKEIIDLVSYIPDNDLALATRLLHRLISIDDTNLAQDMIRRYPSAAVSVIVEAIENSCAQRGEAVHRAWMNALSTQKGLLLDGGFIDRSKSTAALSLFASIFGYAQPDVLHAGAERWVQGLKNAQDNIHGEERRRFLVFLLGLALYQPKGTELLFETSFEIVYEGLRDSKINLDSLTELKIFLPTLGWAHNWDTCLRLRLGVIIAYVKGDLDVKSFHRLARGRLYQQLLDDTHYIEGGTKLVS